MMGLYFFSIFSLLLPVVKISAFTTPVNQSVTTNPLNENSTTNIIPTNYECVNKATWFGTSGFSQHFYDDCQEALDVMDLADFLRYEMHTRLEFLSADATPLFPWLGHLRTPRRYTYGRLKVMAFRFAFTNTSFSVTGTCTWAIVSLKDIPPGQLPNAPSGPYPASDVTTFDEFYDSALFGVESRCLKHGSLGYAIVGESFSSVLLLQKGLV